MNWNNLTHLPSINGVTLKASEQLNGNFTLETLGLIPMSDLQINDIFRSVMGYKYIQANLNNPDFTHVRKVNTD